MPTCNIDLEFFRTPPGIALLASVVGGVVVIFIWVTLTNWAYKKIYPDQFTQPDGGQIIAQIGGGLERLLLTILTLWVQPALGPLAAGVLTVRVALGWGEFEHNKLKKRFRLYASFLNGLVSVIWAIAWGVWGMPHSLP
jgi:hypothetical protein